MKDPAISIILPTYNGSSLLPQSIESCLSQTFTDFELIIVNDCSTDNTLEVAQAYAAKDARIKVISNETNQRLPASLNIGFAASKGTYLTWTSDDNVFLPTALERMYQELTRTNSDLIYANFNVISETGEIIEEKKLKGPKYLFDYNFVGFCFLYTRNVYEQLGGYRVDLFCAEDYEYWLRIWANGFKVHHLPETLYHRMDNPASLTATKRPIILEKTIQVKLEYAESAPVSRFGKAKALFRLYRKSPSQEIVQTMMRLAPVYTKYLLLRHKLQGCFK